VSTPEAQAVYGSGITFTDAQDLIPLPVATEIIGLIPQTSAAMAKFRRVTMSSRTLKQPVLGSLPVAYWVSGDTGLKQTAEMAWSNVMLHAEELAVILPIPEAILDDSAFPLWDEAKPWIAAAIAVALDQAVLAGIGTPASWPTAIIPAAYAANRFVTIGSAATAGGLAEDLNKVFATVEGDNYDVNGIVAKRAVRAALRSARDTTGQKLLDVSQDEIEGVGITYVYNNVFPPHNATPPPPDAHLIAGDFSMGLLGVRQDLQWKMLDQAVISDATGKVILNLAQQDSVAMRVVARFAFAVANPVSTSGQVAGAYPFCTLTGALPSVLEAEAEAEAAPKSRAKAS
jgi:HK97 family phage major capsid protein